MKRLASPVIWRGILAIGVGVIAVAWPAITIWAFVILFAAYAFLARGYRNRSRVRSEIVGPVAGHLALALPNVAAAVVALAWPGITALALAFSLRCGRSSSISSRCTLPSAAGRPPASGRCSGRPA